MSLESSFYFYDLETSGFNPREARIMQFAGQRTDMDLNPIGGPDNYLIKMTPDILPDPGAILVTGITPQKTIKDGLTEADFLDIFHEKVATANTIFVGYNTLRFDDEFMRFCNYRNFYDPYDWSWKDGRSRWDILDLARMTRALRPDGIEWPFKGDGKPTVQLELMAEVNGLEHTDAHDALSDVTATIGLANLIRSKQPKLFGYLLGMRDKKKVADLVNTGNPFVYTSGRYANDHQKTTIAAKLSETREGGNALVFDLRFSPMELSSYSSEKLAQVWKTRYTEREFEVPIKTMRFNRCPAISPTSVLDDDSKERLSLNIHEIEKHTIELDKVRNELREKIYGALAIMDSDKQERLLETGDSVDTRLYDGFFPDSDRPKLEIARKRESVEFDDERLNQLLPLYKARNYPDSLDANEQAAWDIFREQRLTAGGEGSRLGLYIKQLEEIASQEKITPEQKYLLEELKLYGESL